MATLKTGPTDGNVEAFLDGIANEARQADCRALVKIMQQVTRAKPVMWGSSIVGFGSYHYRYASGREGDWFLTGFSPRKNDLTLYIMAGFEDVAPLLAQLGKHRTGKSCLYLKGLADVDRKVLKELIRRSVQHLRKTHGGPGTQQRSPGKRRS